MLDRVARRTLICVATVAAVLAVSQTGHRATAAEVPVVVVDVAFSKGETGYWILDNFGRVTVAGDGIYHGGAPELASDVSAVAIEATTSGDGYFVFASNGAVYPFGDARFAGDASALTLNEPIIGAAVITAGNGYYLLGADGGVFAYGDATFHGSIQGVVDEVISPGYPAIEWLQEPVVGIAPTTTGQGYWLVASDGGLFSFGDAAFHGSIPGVLAPGVALAGPIVDIVAQADGYMLVALDGGVFSFGSSQFHGSVPGVQLENPTDPIVDVDVVAVVPSSDGSGYAMVERDAVIWPFGRLATQGPLIDLVTADVTLPANPGDTRGCVDFVSLRSAQQWFDEHRPFYGDVAQLDADIDGVACENEVMPVAAGLRVALIGDAGNGPDAAAVLELIADQNADLVIHLGDFDYADDPTAFEASITAALGADFPYFAAVGNHDVPAWAGYQQRLMARLDRVEGAVCIGDYGVNSACTYRGLSFILSGVGTLGSGHEEFLEQSLAADRHTWRICAWHKNQHTTQVGAKSDEVGWQAFETCRKHGAIIANGHEHSYSRTKTISDFAALAVDEGWPDGDEIRVGRGSTFMALSGLGGHSVRPQVRCLPAIPPYGCDGEWASISSETSGAKPGALFLDLHLDDDGRKGQGTFIDVDGNIIDSFTIKSEANLTP